MDILNSICHESGENKKKFLLFRNQSKKNPPKSTEADYVISTVDFNVSGGSWNKFYLLGVKPPR